MIFADTSALYALTVPQDPRHRQADRWMAANTDELVITDYVVDETLTLLRAHGLTRRAARLGGLIFGGRLGRLYHVTESDVLEAWETFQRYSDKGWSFTDCTSKVVMDKLQLDTAFALDQHFRQFGSISVVP